MPSTQTTPKAAATAAKRLPASMTLTGLAFTNLCRLSDKACPEPDLSHLPDGDQDAAYEKWEMHRGNALGRLAEDVVKRAYGAEAQDLRVGISDDEIEVTFTLLAIS